MSNRAGTGDFAWPAKARHWPNRAGHEQFAQCLGVRAGVEDVEPIVAPAHEQSVMGKPTRRFARWSDLDSAETPVGGGVATLAGICRCRPGAGNDALQTLPFRPDQPSSPSERSPRHFAELASAAADARVGPANRRPGGVWPGPASRNVGGSGRAGTGKRFRPVRVATLLAWVKSRLTNSTASRSISSGRSGRDCLMGEDRLLLEEEITANIIPTPSAESPSAEIGGEQEIRHRGEEEAMRSDRGRPRPCWAQAKALVLHWPAVHIIHMTILFCVPSAGNTCSLSVGFRD